MGNGNSTLEQSNSTSGDNTERVNPRMDVGVPLRPLVESYQANVAYLLDNSSPTIESAESLAKKSSDFSIIGAADISRRIIPRSHLSTPTIYVLNLFGSKIPVVDVPRSR